VDLRTLKPDVHCKISSNAQKNDEHTGNILQIYFIVTVHHIEKMFLDRVYNVTTVSYENIVFWIIEASASLRRPRRPQEGSGRLRRAQAGPGSPRQPRQPQDGSGMSAMAQQHAQVSLPVRLRHA
jgi:hypothetical protein